MNVEALPFSSASDGSTSYADGSAHLAAKVSHEPSEIRKEITTCESKIEEKPTSQPPSKATIGVMACSSGALREGDLDEELTSIQAELARLQERRAALEEQREKILAASLPPRTNGRQKMYANGGSLCTSSRSKYVDAHSTPLQMAMHDPHPTAISTASCIWGSSLSRLPRTCSSTSMYRGEPSRSCGTSTSRHSRIGRTVGSHSSATHNRSQSILPESVRRECLKQNPYRMMKSAIQSSNEHDSTCIMGGFLLENSSRIYTFGRERRFLPFVNRRGKQYLGAGDDAPYCEAQRRRGGSKLSGEGPHMYASGGVPGPGAYTPRYSKVSKPSVLTYL